MTVDFFSISNCEGKEQKEETKNLFPMGFSFLFGKNLGRKSEDHSLYIELIEKKYLLSGHLCLSSFGLGIILEFCEQEHAKPSYRPITKHRILRL